MALADQEIPAWLQRNWAPKEPFDPTPWLQERFRRQVIQAKLPLELQQMELANKAAQLEIETRGLQNDLVNQEMNAYAQELPALREYMSQAEGTAGGAISLPPPAFRSKRAMAAIAERQKIDADTGYGIALNRTITEQTKNVAEWMPLANMTIAPRPDGTFDPQQYALLGEMAAQAKQASELEQISVRSGGSFTPVIETPVNPLTGEKVPVLRTGPNASQPLGGKEPADLIGLETKRARLAREGGDEELAQFHDARRAKLSMSPETTITSPDGTVVRMGPAGAEKGGLTVATQTRLQEQAMINKEALTTLGGAVDGILATPESIGVRGVFGELIEKVRGQLSPGAAMDTPITDVRQKASIAFSRIAPALRVDSGNMSKYELNKLEQAGDVLSLEEAPQTAVRKLNNLQAVIVGRQLRLLKTQGKIPDEVLLRQIQGEEIAGLIQEGLLSREDAMRLYQLKRPNGR